LEPEFSSSTCFFNFGVYDILAREDSSELVVIDQQTGALSLVYKGEVFSFDAQSIVQIPDYSNSFNFNPGELNTFPSPGFNGTINASNTENFVVPPNQGVELHGVRFKNGNLSLSVSTTLRHNVTLNVTFPGLIKNGSPIVRTVQLNYAGTVPQTATASVDLTDVQGDFTLNGTTVNSLRMICNSTIQGTGQNLSGNENIDVQLSMTNLEFKNITGYFGQQNVAVDGDTILMRLFQNQENPDAYFQLTNPKVKFTAENSFGFPARINLANLKTINVNTGQEFPLTGFPNTINVNAPATMGQTATTSVELNTSNTSNLSSIISPVPKYFYFEVDALSNPNGPSTLNFAEDVSSLKVKAEVELPLEGFAYGFSIKDTVDFNLALGDDFEITHLMLRMIVDNGFPIGVGTQLRFMDANYNTLFSTFSQVEYLVQPALVDGNGKVNQRTKKINDITLNESQLALINQVKFIEIYGESQTLNGPNQQVVKLFDSYTIYVKLSAQVEGKTSF
jgi:hypothetical protein